MATLVAKEGRLGMYHRKKCRGGGGGYEVLSTFCHLSGGGGGAKGVTACGAVHPRRHFKKAEAPLDGT